MREHLYLKGDVKSVDIAEVLCFFTNTTASIVAKQDLKIRQGIEIQRRATGKQILSPEKK